MKRKINYILIASVILPMFFGILPFFAFNTPVARADMFLESGGTAEDTSVSSVGAAAGVTASTLADPTATPTTKPAFECDILTWTGFGFGTLLNVITCGITLIVWTIWSLTVWLLQIAGSIFDAMAAFTLGSQLFASAGGGAGRMINEAWSVVRDIANLGLIFGLLYVAIATILQAGGVQLKKAVANIIIIALLVNFSAFFTKVVIDASNIIATSMYSRIVANASPQTSFVQSVLGLPAKSISSAVSAGFDPQKILDKGFNEKAMQTSKQNVYSLIYLLSAIINLVAVYVFLRAAILLVGRVVAFIFLIIASPLAFVSWALPGSNFNSKWWSMLVDQALVAPVFFFFMFVITTVLNGSFLDSIFLDPLATPSVITFFISMIAHLLVIIVAMIIAIKVTTKLSGDAGSYATKALGGVVGGVVLGGAAFAGRHTIGRAAKGLQDSAAFKQFAAKSGVVGEYFDRGLGGVAKANMDLRNIGGIEGLGKAGGKGGYQKSLDEQIKRKVELGKRLEKGKHGENVLATNWRGQPVTEMETQYEDVLDSAGKPVFELDSHGKPLMGPDGKPLRKRNIVGQKQRWITAREQYTRKLEQGSAIFPDFKKQGYEAARKDRDAARELRKVPTETDKIIEALTKSQQPQPSAPPPATP